MLFMIDSEPTFPTLLQKLKLIKSSNVVRVFSCARLVRLCKLYPRFPVVSWQQWLSVLSICFSVFRDVLLHTLIVTSGYVRYCCLPVSSKQSGYSLLSSPPRELLLTEYFSLSVHFCKPWRQLYVKIPVDQLFVKYSTHLIWHQQQCHIQITFPPSVIWFELQQKAHSTPAPLH